MEVKKAPRGAPSKAPILRNMTKLQSDIPFVIKKVKNPTMQMGDSAKVVDPIELLQSLPAITWPLVTTGPKPPPDNPLLKVYRSYDWLLFQFRLEYPI